MEIAEADVLMFRDIEGMLQDLLFVKNQESPRNLEQIENIESSIGWLQEFANQAEKEAQ